MIEGNGHKRSTIIRIIKNKINHWINTITDKDLQDDIRNHYILTGGAITSLLLGQEPNDYDLYFDEPNVAKRLIDYYVNTLDNETKIKVSSTALDNRVSINIQSSGIIRGNDETLGDYQYFEQGENYVNIDSFLNPKKKSSDINKYEIAMITTNAISLTNDIQLVFRFVGSANEIHKNYDFVHVTNYYTEKDGLVLNNDALEAVLSKTLVYVGSLYPICSMFRIRKFLKRGWSISAGEMLKISFDISKLDLDNSDVLKDQLIGVDVAYFQELIGMFKEAKVKDPAVVFSRSYLFELINKVFEGSDID